jgi:hypothetical protein
MTFAAKQTVRTEKRPSKLIGFAVSVVRSGRLLSLPLFILFFRLFCVYLIFDLVVRKVHSFAHSAVEVLEFL